MPEKNCEVRYIFKGKPLINQLDNIYNRHTLHNGNKYKLNIFSKKIKSEENVNEDVSITCQ